MNDKKDDNENIYHNLSNTIQIKVTQQSRENNSLLDQKEREKRLILSKDSLPKTKNNNNFKTKDDFKFHISNLKNINKKESNKCKEIDLKEFSENVKNLHSILEEQKEYENSNIFNLNNSNNKNIENSNLNNNNNNNNNKNNNKSHIQHNSSKGKLKINKV